MNNDKEEMENKENGQEQDLKNILKYQKKALLCFRIIIFLLLVIIVVKLYFQI